MTAAVLAGKMLLQGFAVVGVLQLLVVTEQVGLTGFGFRALAKNMKEASIRKATCHCLWAAANEFCRLSTPGRLPCCVAVKMCAVGSDCGLSSLIPHV